MLKTVWPERFLAVAARYVTAGLNRPGRTTPEFVHALYHTMLLRDVDSGGFNLWLGQVDPPNGPDCLADYCQLQQVRLRHRRPEFQALIQ